VRVVKKFALITGPHLDVFLPRDSEPRSAQVPKAGDEHVQICVEVDNALLGRPEKSVRFDFYLVGTDVSMPQGFTNLRFLATVEDRSGKLGHVYWRKEDK
jgi:hypothetical protein